MYYGTTGLGLQDLPPAEEWPLPQKQWRPDAGYRSRAAADAGSGAAAMARAEGAWKVCRAQYQEQYGMSPEEAGAAATEGPCPPEPPEEEEAESFPWIWVGVGGAALVVIGYFVVMR